MWDPSKRQEVHPSKDKGIMQAYLSCRLIPWTQVFAQVLGRAAPHQEMAAPAARSWGWDLWGAWRDEICLGFTPRSRTVGFGKKGCDDLLYFPCVGNAWASWPMSFPVEESGGGSFLVPCGLLLWDLVVLWFCVTLSVAAQDYCAREKFPPCHGKHAPAVCPPEQSHLSARTSHPARCLGCREEWWDF